MSHAQAPLLGPPALPSRGRFSYRARDWRRRRGPGAPRGSVGRASKVPPETPLPKSPRASGPGTPPGSPPSDDFNPNQPCVDCGSFPIKSIYAQTSISFPSVAVEGGKYAQTTQSGLNDGTNQLSKGCQRLAVLGPKGLAWGPMAPPQVPFHAIQNFCPQFSPAASWSSVLISNFPLWR